MTRIIGALFKELSGKNRAKADLSGDGEIIEVRRLGQYAIYSKPLKNSKGLLISNGNSTYIIAEKNPQELPIESQLADGDFAVDTGNVRMHFKHKEKTLEISGAVSVSIKGANEIKLGNAAMALVNEQIVQWLDSHTHTAPGGATGTPIPPAATLKDMFTTKVVKGA
jgi:hypothetical protein